MKPTARLLAALLVLLGALQLRADAAVIIASSDADIARASAPGGSKPGDLVLVVRPPAGTRYAPVIWRCPGVTIQAVTPGEAVFGGGFDCWDVRAQVTLRGLTAEDAGRNGFRFSAPGCRVEDCRSYRSRKSGFITGDCQIVLERCVSVGSLEEHGYYNSGVGSSGSVVRGCVATDNAGSGEQANAQGSTSLTHVITGITVEGCTFEHNGSAGGSAINWIGVQSSEIRNNKLSSNLAGGISFSASDATHPEWGSKNNVLTGNVVSFRPTEGRWALSFTQGSIGNTVTRCTLTGGKAGIFDLRSGFPPGATVYPAENTYTLGGNSQFWTDGTQHDYASWVALGVDVGSVLKPLGVEP